MLNGKVLSAHVRILNFWLMFILALVISNGVPHWPNVKAASWINCALLFCLSVQAISIATKEVNHKSIFVTIATWTFLSSIQIVNAFIGPSFALGGSAELSYAIMDGRRMVMPLLASFVILHLVLRVVLDKVREWAITALSALISGGAAFYCYRHNLWGAAAADIDTILAMQSLGLLALPLAALLGFWIYQYKKDFALSDHITVLMAFFTFYVVVEIVDLLTVVLGVKLYSVSQLMLSVVLGFLMITFFNRLNYLYSEFGQYYERLLTAGSKSGVQIIRKQSRSLLPVIEFLRIYFAGKPKRGAVATILVVFAMNIFGLPDSLKAFVFVLAIAFTVLSLYWSGLTKKRDLKNQLLNFKR